MRLCTSLALLILVLSTPSVRAQSNKPDEAARARAAELSDLAAQALLAGDALAAGDWAGDAVDLDPANITALHVLGVTQIVYGEWEPAIASLTAALTLVERSSPPTVKYPNRPLVLNLAIAEVASAAPGDNVRGIRRLVEYLEAQAKVDETALNILGAALAWCDEETGANNFVQAAINAYTQWDAQLNTTRTDAKRWGIEWVPVAEHQPLVEQWQQAESALQVKYQQSVEAAQNLRRAYVWARQQMSPNLFRPVFRNDIASNATLTKDDRKPKMGPPTAPRRQHYSKDAYQWVKPHNRQGPIGKPVTLPDIKGEAEEYRIAMMLYREAKARVPRPRFPEYLTLIPFDQQAPLAEVNTARPTRTDLVLPREPRGDMRQKTPEAPKQKNIGQELELVLLPGAQEWDKEEPLLLPPAVALRVEQQKFTRSATAFAVTARHLVTTSGVVENSGALHIIDRKGNSRQAIVVRTHPHAGIALIQVLGGDRLRPLAIAEAFEKGKVQMLTNRLTADAWTSRAAAGEIYGGRERLGLDVPFAPRRGGAPLIAQNRVVGVAVASRGWNARDLPFANHAELLELLSGLGHNSGPFAPLNDALFEVRATARVQP